MNPRRLLFGCLVMIIAAAAFGYFVFPWPAMRRGRQVRNCADMQVYATLLHDYYDTHKTYPSALRDAVSQMSGPSASGYRRLRDGYDRRVRYESRGQQFVLISYGSDGEPEAADYWSYRLRSQQTFEEEAQACNAGGDVVFTDRGCFRCCGK